MRNTVASVITIGDELLIGQRTDTNSKWICEELNKIGATVKLILSIGDTKEDITEALKITLSQSDVVLITGGLGPTRDDITKKTLAEFFDSGFVTNEEVLQDVKSYFTQRGREMKEVHFAQADVPQKCRVIRNTRGTAPGMWFDDNGKSVFSMPGVPYEMKDMMTNSILDLICEQHQLGNIIHKTISTAGIGESTIAEIIQEDEDSLPSSIKLAYLPTPGMVKLRLSGDNIQESDIEPFVASISKKLEKYVFSFEDISLEEVLAKTLMDTTYTIATAESCTSGFLAHLLTKTPGSSKFYLGGIVAYDNQVKINELDVSAQILDDHGAVSEETVILMAENVRKKLGSTFGLATSGVAGPGGGTPDKPVGTVWIACATPSETKTQLLQLTKDRMLNIQLTAFSVLNMLRQSL